MTTPTPDVTGAKSSWLRLDIQGLRAIAVLLVVTYHSGLPVPGGFTGVDVFFVISGFVITELILRKQAAGGFRLREFYLRRMRRLLPALALVVILTLIASIFLESPFGPQRTTALTGLGSSFFIANFVIYFNTGGYFDAPAELNPLLHTWTLSVEEQFYFVFPALMIAALFIARRSSVSSRTIAIAALSVVIALSFAAALLLGFGLWAPAWLTDGPSWAFYSSVTRAWEFSVGALLALVLRGRTFPSALAAPTVWLGLTLIAVGAVAIDSSMVFPGVVALIPVLGTAAVIAGGSAANPSAPSRGLAMPVIVWIGALSYSWYLWHWPAIVFTGQLLPGDANALIVAGALSLVPAWLSYRFLETPLRTSPRIHGYRIPLVVGLAVAVPAVASLVVLRGSENSWNNSDITRMSQQIQPVPVSFVRGCDFGTPLGPDTSPECTWHAGARGKHVYLVGDSQAGQFAEAAIEATAPLERPLTIATEGSCPFLTTFDSEEPLSSPECEDFVDATIAWLGTRPASTVLIGMSGNYVTDEFEEQLRIRLIRSIEALQAAGHDVRLFQATPQFPEWTPYSCTVFDLLTSEDGCGVSVPRAVMDDRQAAALRLFSQAASATGIPLIDVRDELCGDESCNTNAGDYWRYRDSFHITVDESVRLTPQVRSGLLR